MADLHFGYELSQRVAGRLMPLWGMDSIENRLTALVSDYRPRRLIIVGDLVHDRAAAESTSALLRRLASGCEIVALAGNHDRQLAGMIPLLDSWETRGFRFHHGHCEETPNGRMQIIGHHHPAGHIRDGAGLRLKLPAFVQEEKCWIMPAFSPWAAGTPWRGTARRRIWLCAPQRVLRLEEADEGPG